jgi:hypothetical protein
VSINENKINGTNKLTGQILVNIFCNTSNQNLCNTGSTCTMNGRMKGKPAPATPSPLKKKHTHRYIYVFFLKASRRLEEQSVKPLSLKSC